MSSMTTMGECQLCGKVRNLAPIQDHRVCEECYNLVTAILIRMLKDPDLWKLINHLLNVSPYHIVETTGYTEPDAPAEPEVASFKDVTSRRRAHKNLR